jgi:hypothetical protein
MKEKWDKFIKFSKSRYGKPALFFGFYFIFFVVVLSLLSSPVDSDNQKNADNINMWDKISNNYEYLYDVTFSNGKVVSLEGKQYNHKNLFTRSVDGVIDCEAYIFYNDASIKKNNAWVHEENFILISNDFNNQYFDIQYIKSLIADSELVKSTTNFNESKSDFYVFGDLKMEVISKDNVLEAIKINHPLYRLTLQYKNINNVNDFVVEK